MPWAIGEGILAMKRITQTKKTGSYEDYVVESSLLAEVLSLIS
jgi:hypothetical protein